MNSQVSLLFEEGNIRSGRALAQPLIWQAVALFCVGLFSAQTKECFVPFIFCTVAMLFPATVHLYMLYIQAEYL